MNGYNVANPPANMMQSISAPSPNQPAADPKNSGTGSQAGNAPTIPPQATTALPSASTAGAQALAGQQLGGTTNSSTPHHPIAEFLYQLTKMLTDDNREIIEWSNGKIKVHHPERLESEVLHKYFRHSKFASFQRQLNYFGFRKIAGKGKMSPCSYVNDAATSDIRSLLLIKRKTNGSAARKAAMAQRGMAAAAAAAGAVPPAINFLTPGLGGGVAALGVGTDLFNKALTGQVQALGAAGLHQSLLIPEMQQQAAALQQQALQSAVAQQKHKPLGESLFFPSDNALAALTQGQKRQSIGDLAGLAMKAGLPGSYEQLGALAAQRNSALNLAALGMAASPAASAAAAASAALAAAMPATAAMNMAGTMPATAAANATAAVAGQGNNLFESSNNLSALVGNDQNQKAPAAGPASAAAPATAQTPGVPSRLSSQNLLTRLPSSSAIFPDSLSSVSLTGLLPGMSSNRLSSRLSLSSFLSRDPSSAELVPGAATAQLGAAAPLMGLPFGGVPLAPLTAAPLNIPVPAPPAASITPGPANPNPSPAPAAPAAAGAAQPVAAPPVGFEPTPIQDM